LIASHSISLTSPARPGGNTGIGKETIGKLLARNAKVYMASRNMDKAQIAINELREQTGRDAIFLPLDLASLSSVRSAAEAFLRLVTRINDWLDCVIKNQNLTQRIAPAKSASSTCCSTMGKCLSGRAATEKCVNLTDTPQWGNVSSHRTSHGRWV
jgi:NAD(P)-dependent dehydrogenase (short-subunit alcohol dehydrogenase family)